MRPIKVASIHGESIRKTARKTTEAGRSGFDAEVWKRLFTSTQLGDSTTDLCNTFLGVIKKLRTAEILSSSLEAFLARCLIPLEKNPGLRTIGVREVLRRISGKVIVMHARDDSVTSVGSLQVCTEHEAGCESMIHAMLTEFMKNNQLKQYYW